MQSNPIHQLLGLLEKYGFLLLTLFAVNLHNPDFTQTLALMELDLSAEHELRSSGNIVRQVFFIALLLGYSACVLGRPSALKHLMERQSIYLKLAPIIGLCFLSSAWSDFTFLSIKRSIFQSIVIIVTCLSVYFALQRNTFSRSITILFFIFLGFSLFSLGLGNSLVNGAFTAWAKSKNNYGAWVLFIIFLLTLRLSFSSYWTPTTHQRPAKKDLYIYWLYQAPLMFFLVLSGSKTSLLLAFFCYLSVLNIKFPFRALAYVTLVGMIILFIAPVIFENPFGERYNLSMVLIEDTLTGRSTIWGLLYSVFESPQKLLLGAGYATFFNTGSTPDVLDIQYSYLQYLNSAHNGYLELALQLGIPITTFILMLLFSMLKHIKLKSSLVICWLIFLYNITESAFLRDQHIMWIAFLVALSIDASYRNKLLVELN